MKKLSGCTLFSRLLGGALLAPTVLSWQVAMATTLEDSGRPRIVSQTSYFSLIDVAASEFRERRFSEEGLQRAGYLRQEMRNVPIDLQHRLNEISFAMEGGRAMRFHIYLKGGMWGQYPLHVRKNFRKINGNPYYAQILRSVSENRAEESYILAIDRNFATDGAQPAEVNWRDIHVVSGERLISLHDVESYVRSRKGVRFERASKQFIDKTVKDFLALGDQAPKYGPLESLCARFLHVPVARTDSQRL